MADEFGHKIVGTVLDQAPYEDVLAHNFDGQAEGDMMIATSAVQLSRLGASTQGYPLVMGAARPQWGGATLLNGDMDAAGQFITWSLSKDSALVADEVSLSGYEIAADERTLAISQENPVVVDVDETKFSHKMPIRINGATYYMMLTAT